MACWQFSNACWNGQEQEVELKRVHRKLKVAADCYYGNLKG